MSQLLPLFLTVSKIALKIVNELFIWREHRPHTVYWI